MNSHDEEITFFDSKSFAPRLCPVHSVRIHRAQQKTRIPRRMRGEIQKNAC